MQLGIACDTSNAEAAGSYLMTMAVDEEVTHLDTASGEGVITHFRHTAGQHIHQRGLAHIGSAN